MICVVCICWVFFIEELVFGEDVDRLEMVIDVSGVMVCMFYVEFGYSLVEF